MRLRRAEQYAVGNNAGAPAAFLKQSQEQSKEKQLCLFRIGNSFKIIVNALGVNRALEWRICKANSIFVTDAVLLGNTVLIVNIGIGDGMEH